MQITCPDNRETVDWKSGVVAWNSTCPEMPTYRDLEKVHLLGIGAIRRSSSKKFRRTATCWDPSVCLFG